MIKQLLVASALMISLNVSSEDGGVAPDEQNTSVSPYSTSPQYYNDCYRQKADNPFDVMMDGMEDMMDSFDSDKCGNNNNNNDSSFWKFWN
jgi:hypothetical protein